jgi:metal-dependent hydrolase (beta-lactamase superfamily II)
MIKKLVFFVVAIIILIAILITGYYALVFKPGLEDVERSWQSHQPNKIVDFGSTKTLSILPLVNWKTSDGRFKGEAGVSYLIKTDHQTLLFDVGFNAKAESPSPLQHNMAELGIQLSEIDTLFLSHHHLDHSGGQTWVNKNTFSLGNEQVDLVGKSIFSPVPVQYTNVDVQVIPDASIVGPGLASIGAISRQLFMGRIEEQALVINVEGKGLVLIVGCGHQTWLKYCGVLHKYSSNHCMA